MNSGIGIGGFSTAKDETASSQFNLFEDLEIETIIGIFGWEREVKQIVNINLEMDFDISKAGKTDNIDDALNYKSIAIKLVLIENGARF